jgi:hypothetical protein
MPLFDADEEARLKQELLRMDVNLRRKQDFWETPRNIVILVGVAAAAAGALGYKIGQNQPPIVINLSPQTSQAPAQPTH